MNKRYPWEKSLQIRNFYFLLSLGWWWGRLPPQHTLHCVFFKWLQDQFTFLFPYFYLSRRAFVKKNNIVVGSIKKEHISTQGLMSMCCIQNSTTVFKDVPMVFHKRPFPSMGQSSIASVHCIPLKLVHSRFEMRTASRVPQILASHHSHTPQLCVQTRPPPLGWRTCLEVYGSLVGFVTVWSVESSSECVSCLEMVRWSRGYRSSAGSPPGSPEPPCQYLYEVSVCCVLSMMTPMTCLRWVHCYPICLTAVLSVHVDLRWHHLTSTWPLHAVLTLSQHPRVSQSLCLHLRCCVNIRRHNLNPRSLRHLHVSRASSVSVCDYGVGIIDWLVYCRDDVWVWHFYRRRKSRTKRSSWWWVTALGLHHAEVGVLLAGSTDIDSWHSRWGKWGWLFSNLWFHIWTEKASPIKFWLLIGSRPAPTIFQTCSNIFPPFHTSTPKCCFWLAGLWCRYGHPYSPTILL